MRGLFVTGTDTCVGKSILSACLVAAMAAAGEPVRAYKPVLTGLDVDVGEEAADSWPADHELLANVSGMTRAQVAPLRFGPAVSPHLAAELAGRRIEPDELIAGARERAEEGPIVVEGVGGLLVPLSEDYSVRDLAVELALPLLIAARPGLGTINHTLLTLEAARAAKLDVLAVILTPWPEQPSALERSNHDTIARLGAVEVHTLATVTGPTATALARAGERLPWRRWLERSNAA